VLVDETAEVGEGCAIGPNVVIGPGVKIGRACCLKNAVVMAGAVIGVGTLIIDSIVGWRGKIGRWVTLSSHTLLGEDVTVKDRLVLVGTAVLPHKSVERSYFEPNIII
jgi:mannose-1-phosphate guanylyltransferase